MKELIAVPGQNEIPSWVVKIVEDDFKAGNTVMVSIIKLGKTTYQSEDIWKDIVNIRSGLKRVLTEDWEDRIEELFLELEDYGVTPVTIAGLIVNEGCDIEYEILVKEIQKFLEKEGYIKPLPEVKTYLSDEQFETIREYWEKNKNQKLENMINSLVFPLRQVGCDIPLKKLRTIIRENILDLELGFTL